MGARGAIFAFTVLVASLLLVGCSTIPASQRAGIDADIKTLDVPSTCHVICEDTYTNGFMSDVPFVYNVSVRGTAAYGELVSRLESNGFVVDKLLSDAHLTWLNGPNKIRAAVVQVSRVDYPYVDFDVNYKCKVPKVGMTQV
ncbi:MAG TPA: hypothetical protein VHZ81_01105 [Galbitalea sp.]|jgi:hypothetical protein|nr:hypothetical protein [Galbitalea sp.]